MTFFTLLFAAAAPVCSPASVLFKMMHAMKPELQALKIMSRNL